MSPNAGFTVRYAVDRAKPDLGRFKKKPSDISQRMNFWGVAAVLVAGEWPSLPDVGSLSQSIRSLAVASGSSFLKAPPVPCMLGGSSFSALLGNWNRFFLRWSGLHPGA